MLFVPAKYFDLSSVMKAQWDNDYKEFLSYVYFCVNWHFGAISLPLADIILAQLACSLNDFILCLLSE